MIIYNVTIKVDNDVADAWVKWMKNGITPMGLTMAISAIRGL